MKKLSSLIDQKVAQSQAQVVYARHEFQDFGLRLAKDLKDLKHKALYIRLAKQEKRSFLLKAKDFAADYPNARSGAKIFMWALTQLKKFGRIPKEKIEDRE